MKGRTKRWLSILVVFCMLFTLAVPMSAFAQTEDITILYTNDVHRYCLWLNGSGEKYY